MTAPTEPELTYATPDPGRKSYWPAAICCGTGLGLILLGGCFLIGVLMITSAGWPSSVNGLTRPQVALMITLYFLAFACFAAAAMMIVAGVRRLR